MWKYVLYLYLIFSKHFIKGLTAGSVKPSFFEQPILNSPYEAPRRHWELEDEQPTGKTIEKAFGELVEKII